MKSLSVALAALTLLAAPAFADDLVTREELSRADAPGSTTHEVIVARLSLAPGGQIPRHTHYGDEYLTVLQGGDMQTGDGRVIHFETGQVVRFPEGVVHGGLTAVGDTAVIAVTTHIVEKGKPLNIPAE
jgi:quercetin dioxygenase-like cupin family protein